MSALLPRFAATLIAHALADTRVVIVNGARQVGKSTVVRATVKTRRDVLTRTLDRPSDLASARADPEGFVVHDGLLVVDEVHRAPEIVLPIKARVDQNETPGQFLLTGSARIMGMKNLPDALVGRSETIELWPFSQCEINGEGRRRSHAVDELFEDEPELGHVGVESKKGYVERVLRGGFPEATKRIGTRRDRFFESYVRDLIDHDVVLLSEIERRDDLVRLVRLLAARQATLIKVDELASTLAIPATTLDRYLRLLDQVFLIKRVPAWSSSATSRAVRMQKLMMVDSGIAAFLTKTTERRLQREPARFGPALENFALSEIARQLTWCRTTMHLFHYRTRDGEEVDAVLEANDGRIVGVEVKAASTVVEADFRHLKHLEKRAGNSFHLGVVFYTGDRILPFGPRLRAVPLDALWAPRSK